MNSINCKGKLLSLDEPVVMGIINATPDSFYKGHLKLNTDEITALAGKMIQDGFNSIILSFGLYIAIKKESESIRHFQLPPFP